MSKDVIIIGAGGHAKVIADIVLRAGDNLIGFLDDDDVKQGKVIFKKYKVIGKVPDSYKYDGKFFVVAIGDNYIRAKIVDKYNGLIWYTAIHPSAVIADTAKIGDGTVVMAGAIVNPDTTIGEHCILNTACSIDHDNVVGDYVHLSPGVNLAGTVSIGAYSWICIGASVINNIRIAGDVVLGAGATAISDIKESGVYIGTPAKRIKNLFARD